MAYASDPPQRPAVDDEVRVVRLESGDIDKHIKTSDEIADNSKALQRVNEYYSSALRAGRLVDEAAVRYVSLPDVEDPRVTVDMVFPASKKPASVSYVAQAGGISAIGTEWAPSLDRQVSLAPNFGAGSGFDGAMSTTNMTLDDAWTSDQWFTAQVNRGSDHYLATSYEAWRPASGTGHWVYNRWGLFTRAYDYSSSWESVDYSIMDYTVAARPWSGTTGVGALYQFEPPGPVTTCPDNPATFTLGASFGGINVGATIPLRQCTTILQLSNVSAKTIKTDLFPDGQGQQTTDQQRRLDAAGRYARNGSAWPTWADYNYVEVKTCWWVLGSGTLCYNPAAYVKKDSGW
ncbi:hypothetical protein [Micromonospora sp. LOL_023]|uniref:hypothetical protein n=1 Tax=Micromonospora sp. LOL_023 TaxID=3345418 RepID=UPI003A872239